ncbi:MAG: TIGR04283 family arsenosugar biosynthesis glycosyltransferase [Gammaproteobacteria bacterium]|jgi:rSAM/selenodomain-associated transferase 2|nr:TIGR04283 family arsenosugar biosynthesis glycosyltransferase [Gammaproteobacteria bacterium]
MSETDLSIIIPTLNEEHNIFGLLTNLSRQTNIHCELIIADGGSGDHTLALVEDFRTQHDLDVKVVTSRPGRAIQMNCGARAASANELLFLHADTQLEQPSLLVNGLGLLTTQRNQRQSDCVAGHFGLQFQRQHTSPSLAYYFYESKTRLNRLDTINGDQGFMLSKEFFHSLGGFDESLEYMEDARLARRIFAEGQWITLPGSLTTSARRFETEGLQQRQILNALLCNFDHIGLPEFSAEAASAYRAQDKTGELQLKPFFILIHRIARRIGFLRTTKLWYKTGAYVAGNAWQLAFALDCRRNFVHQLAPGEGPTPKLRFYDHWLKPVIDSPPGHLIATGLTFIWFYSLLVILVLRK